MKDKIDIEYIEDEESHLWNEFVKSAADSTLFHIWEFGEALSLTYRYRKYYLAAIKNKRDIFGVFPMILIKSSFFGNKLVSLPFCEYGGPIINSNAVDSESVITLFIDEALRIASGLNVDYIEIRNPPLLYGKLLESKRFKAIERYVTFEMNLCSGKEELWRSLHKKTRNSIRKAMNSNIIIYEADGEDMLKEYFKLYLEVQKRHGSPPHSFKLFINLLKMKDNIKILMAEHDGTKVAGIIIFHNKNGIHWWGGVSNLQFRFLNATNLLLWRAIEWGIEQAYPVIRLGRTRKETGVYHFKKGWGGKETSYTDYVYSIKNKNTVTPDPSEGKYHFLTKLWSHMPIFMSRLIGPKIIKQIGL